MGLFLVLFGAALGVPIPEEVPILAGGALAHARVVRWWIALPICLVGVVAGDVLLYWLGHRWGEEILEWRLVRHVLSRERETSLMSAYRRHGVKIVVVARHVIGLRAAAFLTAGIARVPFVRFLAADAAAALVGVPLSFGIAYFFADQLQAVLEDVHRVERWFILLGMVAVAAWLAKIAWRKGRAEVGEGK